MNNIKHYKLISVSIKEKKTKLTHTKLYYKTLCNVDNYYYSFCAQYMAVELGISNYTFKSGKLLGIFNEDILENIPSLDYGLARMFYDCRMVNLNDTKESLVI